MSSLKRKSERDGNKNEGTSHGFECERIHPCWNETLPLGSQENEVLECHVSLSCWSRQDALLSVSICFPLTWRKTFFFLKKTGFLFCCKDLFYSFSYYCNESHQLQFLILFCRLLGIFWKCARIGEYFFMHNIVTFFSPSGTKTLADLVAFNLILSILSRWAEESLGGVLLCHHGFQYTVSSVAKGPKDNQLNGDIWRNGQTVKCGRSYLRSTLRHWVAAALITYRSQSVMEMSLLQRRSRSL